MPVHVDTQFVFEEPSSYRYSHYREGVVQLFFGAVSLKSEVSNPSEYLAWGRDVITRLPVTFWSKIEDIPVINIKLVGLSLSEMARSWL